MPLVRFHIAPASTLSSPQKGLFRGYPAAAAKKIPGILSRLSLALALFLLPLGSMAQGSSGATGAFRSAANMYISGQQQEALQAVEQGLRKYPNDPKLLALAEKLKQEEQQNQQQQQQNNQQNQQNQQQQQQQPGDQQGEQDQSQQGEQKDQPGEQQKRDTEQQQEREAEQGNEKEVQPLDARGETEKRLQEMNISPEKARMLLEAMRSNEIQYLQQKQRQPARRPKSNKPDW